MTQQSQKKHKILDRAGDFVSKITIHLVEKQVVSETVNELLHYLGKVTPEQLLEASEKNYGLFNVHPQDKLRWEKRILAAAKIAKKFKKVEKVTAILDSLTPLKLFEHVAIEANEKGLEEVITNLSFISQTPDIMNWYKLKVDETRKWVKEKFLAYVDRIELY